MKKNLSTKVKDVKAITLIALVITIVVLIILAAVAINLSLGNNGIFNRAKTAKEQYQNAQDYEKIEIDSKERIDTHIKGEARGTITEEQYNSIIDRLNALESYRTGTISLGGIPKGGTVTKTVTFDEPREDSNYKAFIMLSANATRWDWIHFRIDSKTANGFNIIAYSTNTVGTSGDIIVDWVIIPNK